MPGRQEKLRAQPLAPGSPLPAALPRQARSTPPFRPLPPRASLAGCLAWSRIPTAGPRQKLDYHWLGSLDGIGGAPDADSGGLPALHFSQPLDAEKNTASRFDISLVLGWASKDSAHQCRAFADIDHLNAEILAGGKLGLEEVHDARYCLGASLRAYDCDVIPARGLHKLQPCNLEARLQVPERLVLALGDGLCLTRSPSLEDDLVLVLREFNLILSPFLHGSAALFGLIEL
mmetsp:Transcript_114494/g.356584  ORF Transcript_114494/g.356584 Transcript_114494/m.356584 type:complete len:232 (-) Transcript_114494:74-769(-)